MVDVTHYPDEPQQGGGSGGIVGVVVTRWRLVVLPRLIALGIEHCTLRIQSSDRLERN